MNERKPTWKLRPKSLEIHGGGSLADRYLRMGVDRVAAYGLGTSEEGRKKFAGEIEGFVYSRIGNRTVDSWEKRLASMEGSEACLATSAGQSAIYLLSTYFCNKDRNGGKFGHIVSSNRLYGGVFHLFKKILPSLGIEVTFVENPFDINEWVKATRYNTTFWHVENPSNPLIEIFDIMTLAKAAHSVGALLSVDSTLASPALLRPLQLGADVVEHSASKYMGDGKVIGGNILSKKNLVDDIRNEWFRDTGPCLSPDNADIFLSSIESLFGRMKEHCANARKVARFLAGHPKVNKVFYPTIGAFAERNKKLMPKGFGGLMSFEVKGGLEAAKTVLDNLELFFHAPNIGESRSLALLPWETTHNQMTDEEKLRAGITPGTIRLSLGREHHLDLKHDLSEQLKRI